MTRRRISYSEFTLRQSDTGNRPLQLDATAPEPIAPVDLLPEATLPAAARESPVAAFEALKATTDSPVLNAGYVEPRSFRSRVDLRGGAVDLLLFRVGTELFGVELDAVEEVLDLPELHRIPEMPETLLGVFSLRGALVALYRPDEALGATPRTGSSTLVFDGGGHRLALAIDDVDDVLTLQLRALRDVPGSDTGDGVLAGVVRRERDLIGVLDVEALLALLRSAHAVETP